MTIAQLIFKYSKQLKSSSPILDIELLLAFTLKKTKEYLYTYPEKKLTTKQLNNFTTLFKRRQKGEPIAYILGHKEFFGLEFKVNKNVLIPRPETEQLVEEVIKYYNQSEISNPQSEISIIEIGVGSGAVIISLAKNLKGVKFIGTDISAKALTVAKQNTKLHKVKIKFLQGNLFTPLTKLRPSDFGLRTSDFGLRPSIIVANLPYLDTKQLNNQQLHYEPKTALAGGPDGLKYFRDFFHQLQQYNLQPQAIFLEIGHNQGTKISKLAKQALPQHKIVIKKDACGFDRIAIIYK